MANIVKITIREAVESDLDEVHNMLGDLIAFQKLPHPPMDKQVMIKDSGLTAANPNKYFHVLVAESEDKRLAGYVLYYFMYKTSKGKYLYVEDIFVKDEFRGSCVGHRLMKEVAVISKKHEAMGIKLLCLDWNPARKFYERCGGVLSGVKIDSWLEYEIKGDSIERLIETLYV